MLENLAIILPTGVLVFLLFRFFRGLAKYRDNVQKIFQNEEKKHSKIYC